MAAAALVYNSHSWSACLLADWAPPPQRGLRGGLLRGLDGRGALLNVVPLGPDSIRLSV